MTKDPGDDIDPSQEDLPWPEAPDAYSWFMKTAKLPWETDIQADAAARAMGILPDNGDGSG